MKKIIFLFVALINITSLFAQVKKQVHLDQSELLRGLTKEVVRVIKPIFSQEGTTLASDSANFNQSQNTFDAFGHVIITQPDGTVISSDLLNYNGNTRIAILTNNVQMVDRNGATLTTNFLTYNMGSKVGTYLNGGKIINGQDILTSKIGYYFSNSRDAYFRYNVVITSPDAVVKADTMRYNSGTKIAYFYGPTHIYSRQDTMYTENGNYNTVSRQAYGFKNNLYQQGTKFLKGDTIFYDDAKGFGRASRNVVFTDNGAQKIMLFGGAGFYDRADTSALITKFPYVVFLTQDSAKTDSIWMTADTLFTKVIPKNKFKPANRAKFKSNAELVDEDETPAESEAEAVPPPVAVTPVNVPAGKKAKASKRFSKPQVPDVIAPDTLGKTVIPFPDSVMVKKPLATIKKVDKPLSPQQLKSIARRDSLMKDSVKLAQDTSHTRIVLAYHHVKIFKSDLQAKADSTFYSYADSTIRMYKNPIVWSQGSQMTGDTIFMQLRNRKLDNMLLQHNGFIVNIETDSAKYNQVKGKLLTGFFKDSHLNKMFVDGNAESIYYAKDSSGYTGLNRSISSRMRISFAKNELSDIVLIRKPEVNFYPIEKVPKDRDILEGFIWKPKERPKSKEEIIPSLRKKKVVSRKSNVKPAKPAVKKPVKKPNKL